MLGFKIFRDDVEEEEEDKHPLICSGCNNVIKDNYFYDKIDQKVYCSKKCFLEQIEKEYFD